MGPLQPTFNQERLVTENANPIDEVPDKPEIAMRVEHTPMPELETPRTKGPVEIQPVVFLDRLAPDAEEIMFDFRPIPDEEKREVEEVLTAPKDSSALVSADFSDVIPEPEPVISVDAGKGSGQPKESAGSTPTS